MNTISLPYFIPGNSAGRSIFSFRRTGAIVGVPPEGRATARLLDFNEENRLQLRRVLRRQGWRP